MPRRDGTGPAGQGGRGRGPGQERGSGRGMGASGECVCPKCGMTTSHSAGAPCNQQKCPSCGSAMIRK